MKTTLTALAVAALGLSAAPAFANPIEVDRVNPTSAFANAAGDADSKLRVITEYEVDGHNRGLVYAGVFRLKSDQAGDLSEFLAFCLQPLANLVLKNDYNVGSIFSETVNNNLNILAANAWTKVEDSETAGAFQMAAWEIATETAEMFDINDGIFNVISDREDSNGAEEVAQGWLNEINQGRWTSNGQQFTILNKEGTQDLLTNVSPVPLPATGLLLLGGLVGAGAVARRKARKAA